MALEGNGFIVARRSFRISLAVLSLMVFGGVPALAQAMTARTPATTNGEVGQRQTVGEAAPNIKPTERIQNRIQNRVQLRLGTRINGTYSPQGTAASAITAANNRVRSTPK